MSFHTHTCLGVEVRRLYIFGAGGSGREIAWLAQQCARHELEIMFLVDHEEYLSPPIDGISVRLAADVKAEDGDYFVAAVGDGKLRRLAAEACSRIGIKAATLIHPRVEMSSRVVIGQGAVICAGSVLTTSVEIGRHVQVNVACSLSNDVKVGDFSTLSPGVHVAGHVEIGRDVFVGTGANIINGRLGQPLRIGDGAVIAAGACVIGPVEAGAMIAGVPGTRKR